MSQPGAHATITLDQETALRSSAERLAREFDGTFGRETIDRFLHSSHEALAVRATVANYLPVLTEKFARQRLRALAKVDGLQVDSTPDADGVRAVRDEIERRVLTLLDQLGVPARA